MCVCVHLLAFPNFHITLYWKACTQTLFHCTLIGESGHISTIIIHYLFLSTPLLTSFYTLTPLSISFSQFSFPSISTEAPTRPCTMWCAIIHLERAILSVNGIIIGPALLLIAKVTIPCMCIWVNMCVSSRVWHLCGCMDEHGQMCPLEQNCLSVRRLGH